MKHILATLLAIIAPLMMLAQNERNWNLGELSWSDFHGSAGMLSTPSAFRASLSIVPTETEINGVTKIKLEAVANMDTQASYARQEARTPELLRLYQAQFDLLESYRRDLQQDLNNGLTGVAADQKLDYYNRLYRSKVQNMVEQTENGNDDAKLQEWEYNVRNRLETQGQPTSAFVTPGVFYYGLYVGTGLNAVTGSIKDTFSNSWAFSAGLQLGYRRLRFKADITYGQPKIHNMNIMNVPDQETTDTYASYCAISLSLGYAVYNSEHFTITPMVGGGWSNYGWNVVNYKYVMNEDTGDLERKIANYASPSLKNFNWYASVDIDYHFYKSVSRRAILTGKREQIVSSLRLSPYIMHGVYNKAVPQMSGFQVGFTVAYSGLANSLGF